MSLSAGITSGSKLLGGIGSMFGGSSLSDAYMKAATQANNQLDSTYNQIRNDESPYTSAGSNAINMLNSDLQNGTGFAKNFTLGDFYSSPGYQFTLQQGNNAINNSAAAQGGLLSGKAAKSLASYSSGLANQTYGDAYNRYLQNRQQGYNELMGVSNLGQTATGQVNNAGLTTGMQKANNLYNSNLGAGAASAGGTMGLLGGIGSGLSSLAQYYANKGK